MKFRIRFVDQVVGIFVLIALAALVAILVLMGMNQRWFAKNYYYSSRFESAGGLSIGMPITLKGFEIGRIDEISLNEDNKVDVIFYIYDTFYEKVKPNSVLELASNPLGLGGGLRFHPGKNKDDPLPENSFIPSLDLPEGKNLVKYDLVAMPEKDDAITSILSKVGPILDSVDETLATVQELLTSVNAAITGEGEGPINDIFVDVTRLTEQVTGLIWELNTRISSVLDNVDAITVNVDDITGNLAETTEAFRDPTGLVPKLLDPKGSIATILDDDNVLFEQIQDILDNVNATISQIESFTGYINKTTPQISGLLEKSREALDQGKDVLEGLKNNPLLRGGISEQKEQASTFQSYRDEDF